LLLAFVFALAAIGQTFSSGSTGADGALDLTAGDRTVQLPASGILNYTTVNIPAGKTLTFGMNLRNTPVVMLAQGAVLISGSIDVAAPYNRNRALSNRIPGPGGFYGGDPGLPGFGPGGGQPWAQGQWIGPLSLVPNIGGSGGGGGENPGCVSPGGGGGGAITIASSVSITVDGTGYIGAGGAGHYNCNYGWEPSGASGAIRLVSNSINVAGYFGSAAVVRLEAPQGALTYSGSGVAPVLATVNPLIVPSNPPVLNIISIGGYPVPSYSGSSFSTIDVLLPTQLQDPIPVVVQATNVPVGSPITIAFSGSAGATSTTANLAGTNASSTATVYVSGVSRGGVSYLFVSTTFSASLISGNLNKANPSGISKIELAAAPGQRTKYRFLRDDGSEISVAKVPADIRRLFGL
jgi:hypothetical protein